MKTIKKLLTFSVSLITLFNLGACKKKEVDLSNLNPNIINPQRMSFMVKEETLPINEFLHDIQFIDIPLNGSEYTRNLQEKLKKSTYNNGVYTLTNSYGFNYFVSDSYLVITNEDSIQLTYSIFHDRKEIIAYEFSVPSVYVETPTHIKYETRERIYQIEFYDNGDYAISWDIPIRYTQFGEQKPIKEVFNKDGYLKEVEFETGVKATRLFGEYTMEQGELIDSKGNKVMDDSVSYQALQYALRGISLGASPWMIIVNEEN